MADRPRGLVVGAPASGTGKTTFTLGLIAALRARGYRVAAAKTGPDYIDPRFLEAAAGAPALNLDLWAMTPQTVRGRIAAHSAGADFIIVEGVMGLFDGAADGSPAGQGSTADLAALLDLPVVFVADGSRQSQSIAALVHGFATFRAKTPLAGVVVTRVGSDRHTSLIRGALEGAETPLFGMLGFDSRLDIASRHLGLVQAMEHKTLSGLVAAAAARVAADIDLDALCDLARPLPAAPSHAGLPPLGQRIAVAHDLAFAFVYPHHLADWRRAGAQLAFFSPLADEAPQADCDAIFLPGGYPELHAGTLANAQTFKAGMTAAAARDCLIYGECGGYMTLGAALIDADGQSHEMPGLLDHVTSFATRERALGYRTLSHASPLPYPAELRGHEFHYSTLETPGSDAPLFEMHDAAGTPLGSSGARRGQVLGSYAHVIDVAEA